MCNMRNLDVYILNTLNRKFIENHKPIYHINTSDHIFIKEYMKTTAKYSPLWYTYQTVYPLVFRHIFSRTTFAANIAQEALQEAGVQLDEFIVNCYFGSRKCNNTEEFSGFFNPYYFNCYTYNAPNSEGKHVLSEGIENGWTSIVFSGSGMLMKNEDIRILPGLHEYNSAVSASEGVRVVIHPPGTQPFPFTEGFDVPPGFSASFGIRPRRIKRIGHPHGNCSKSNPMDSPDSTENSYRTMACQKMCLQKYIITECGCKDIMLPDLQVNETIKPCRNNDLPDDCMYEASESCLTHFFQLYERITCMSKSKDFLMRNTTLLEQCGCFPPCDEISYDISYSLSKWPATGYEGDAAFFDVFYIEHFWSRFNGTNKFDSIREYFSEGNRERAMKDFARLNAYIADSNVIITHEKEDYTSTQLLSDIGGQLGLWVGISIITLAEALELIWDLCRYVLTARRPAPHRHYANVNRSNNDNSTKNHLNNMYVSALDNPHEEGNGGDVNHMYRPANLRETAFR